MSVEKFKKPKALSGYTINMNKIPKGMNGVLYQGNRHITKEESLKYFLVPTDLIIKSTCTACNLHNGDHWINCSKLGEILKKGKEKCRKLKSKK